MYMDLYIFFGSRLVSGDYIRGYNVVLDTRFHDKIHKYPIIKMKRRDHAVNNEAIIASWQLFPRMQNGPGLPYETSKMTHFLSSVGISSLP